jgi:3-deoxy-D-manno-octulosonate 8-phosphate phosphatase (KDO 8-P phosphatase)
VNDAKIMSRVGFSACPSDASPVVRSLATVILDTPGGAGVVREFTNRFIMSDEEWLKRA